jgi:hypothetical protein
MNYSSLMNWIQKIFNKKKHKLMNVEKLMSLKENFTGQTFQWIKPDSQALLGKLVKCKDIDSRGNKFFAIFDDGSSIDIERLNSNLLMIHGDLKPLTREEVESIYSVNFRPAVQNKVESPQVKTQHRVEASPQIENQKIRDNMFNLFNTEESIFNVKLTIKLPDKKLLKLMYNSAENKVEFLDQLSEYLLSKIDKSAILNSAKSLLDVVQPEKSIEKIKPQIKITEANDSKRF